MDEHGPFIGDLHGFTSRMVFFHSYVTNYQRVNIPLSPMIYTLDILIVVWFIPQFALVRGLTHEVAHH